MVDNSQETFLETSIMARTEQNQTCYATARCFVVIILVTIVSSYIVVHDVIAGVGHA